MTTPTGPQSWRPPSAAVPDGPAPVTLFQAVRRGVANRCPNCGVGKVFAGFLTIRPACSECGARLGELHADDAPPYIVIFLAGHILVPPIFWIEKAYEPPMWLHMVVWLPLFAVVCTLLLRPVKGAVVGWMWHLGFAPKDEPEALSPTEPLPLVSRPARDG